MLTHCPRLTPIQARLLATLSALGTLALLYWAFAQAQTAYAAELNDLAMREGLDHDWHQLQQDLLYEEEAIQDTQTVQGADQGSIVARDDVFTIDANDSPNRGNLSAGQTNFWRYTQSLLQSPYANQAPALPSELYSFERAEELRHTELRRRGADSEEMMEKRATERTVYISINTCSQPTWNSTIQQDDGPPQLVLYIGQDGAQDIGPGSSASQDVRSLVEGLVQYSFNTTSDFYMAVAASPLSSSFIGGWTYDIAVSIDDYYHASDTSVPFLYLVDTDSTSALLVTENLTNANANESVWQQWMGLSKPLPFTMFANAHPERTLGLTQSYCGLNNVAQINMQRNNSNATHAPFIQTSMVSRGIENKPKQQFVVKNLASSQAYNATLALVGNGLQSGKSVVRGGGTVWQSTNWTTKTDGNCRLMYDMDFCTDVAYAVPSNQKNTASELSSMYDDYAKQLYQNFTYSLMQIQCNTTNDQKYSLARNCDDCASAYKQWLCAVTIPRCEDYSSHLPFLQARNVAQAFLNGSMLSDDILLAQSTPMPGAPTLPGSPIFQTVNWSYATNQSRNPTLIDRQIAPGPYKEVLPCEDICYNLVQSCPAALQFSCPLPGRGLEAGYASRPTSKSIIQCNFPGAVYYIDDARHLLPSTAVVIGVALITMALAHI